jgi:hypothetical protein
MPENKFNEVGATNSRFHAKPREFIPPAFLQFPFLSTIF